MKDLLIKAKLTKTAFAQLLGIKLGTVVEWKDDPPKYAIVVLQQYIELREYRQLKIVFKRLMG